MGLIVHKSVIYSENHRQSFKLRRYASRLEDHDIWHQPSWFSSIACLILSPWATSIADVL